MTIDRKMSETDQRRTKNLYSAIFSFLSAAKAPPELALPALMAATASLSAISEETDEYIINEFKKCLLDARTRGATKQ